MNKMKEMPCDHNCESILNLNVKDNNCCTLHDYVDVLCNFWIKLSNANDKNNPEKVREYLTDVRDVLIEMGGGNWTAKKEP